MIVMPVTHQTRALLERMSDLRKRVRRMPDAQIAHAIRDINDTMRIEGHAFEYLLKLRSELEVYWAEQARRAR
jgi:hypothetical protein